MMPIYTSSSFLFLLTFSVETKSTEEVTEAKPIASPELIVETTSEETNLENNPEEQLDIRTNDDTNPDTRLVRANNGDYRMHNSRMILFHF